MNQNYSAIFYIDRILPVVIVLILLSSCKSSNQSVEVDYNSASGIGIGEFHYYQSQKKYGGQVNYAFFRDDKGNFLDGTLELNNQFYKFDETVSGFHRNAKDSVQCYGDTLTIAFQSKDSSVSFQDHFYVPQIIEFKDLDANEISRGTTIQWNADEYNDQGVILSFAADKLFQTDTLLARDTSFSFSNTLRIKDNGKYKIGKSALKGLPKGARIEISLMRLKEHKISSPKGLKCVVLVSSASSQSYVLYQ